MNGNWLHEGSVSYVLHRVRWVCFISKGHTPPHTEHSSVVGLLYVATLPATQTPHADALHLQLVLLFWERLSRQKTSSFCMTHAISVTTGEVFQHPW